MSVQGLMAANVMIHANRLAVEGGHGPANEVIDYEPRHSNVHSANFKSPRSSVGYHEGGSRVIDSNQIRVNLEAPAT